MIIQCFRDFPDEFKSLGKATLSCLCVTVNISSQCCVIHQSRAGTLLVFKTNHKRQWSINLRFILLTTNQCLNEGAPIYGVIYKGDAQMLDLLIKNGADVNQVCQLEELGYPIHLAINLLRFEQIKQLMAAGARLDVRDAKGRTIDDLLRLHQNPELTALFNKY